MWINIRSLTFAILLAFQLIQFSCTQKKEIKGFDAESWRKDIAACTDKRKEAGQYLYDHQQELIGMKAEEIVEILGKPDKTDYQGRAKFSYSYYIEPGKQCDPSKVKEGDLLVVEVESLGRMRGMRLQTGL